jgi:hypothetical protein
MLTATTDLFITIRTILGDPKPALTDAFLSGTAFGTAAEETVLAWIGDPPYASRTADEKVAIGNAVAYQTAANWVRSQRVKLSLTGERFSSQYQWSGKGIDVDAWISDLEARARAYIVDLLPVEVTARAPTGFRLAAGRRGQGYTV